MRNPPYWVEAEQAGGRWLGLSMWERQGLAEAEMRRLAAYQPGRRYRVVMGNAVVARANFPDMPVALPDDAPHQSYLVVGIYDG